MQRAHDGDQRSRRRLARTLAGGASYSANPASPGPRFLDASGRQATDGVLADDWGDDLAFGYELSANGLKHVDAAVTVDEIVAVLLLREALDQELDRLVTGSVPVDRRGDGVAQPGAVLTGRDEHPRE